MRPVRFSDESIAAVLRETNGNIAETARLLGYHRQSLDFRVKRSPKLWAMVCTARMRPQHGLRVVTSEAIATSLRDSGSVKEAARSLGVDTSVIRHRAAEPAVQAALSQLDEKALAAHHERVAVRRREVEAKVAARNAHAELLREMRDRWVLARDSWVLEARERGLTLEEMGRIMGITRERVRQLENEIGVVPRSKEKVAS